MKIVIASILMSLVTASHASTGERFACNLSALTKAERAAHEKLSQALVAAVQERREVEHGYAFRLPASALRTTAEWVSYEQRCCPFFTFELEVTRDSGPLWLRVTGSEWIKPFIRSEFGLEEGR
jgi:hypothetical protein